MTSENKRILFIITQSEMGGAQRFLYNFLNRISNRYDILVATGSPRWSYGEAGQSHEKAGSDGGSELAEKLKSLNIDVFKLENLKREISPASDIRACYEIRDLINKFKPDTLFLLSSKAGFLGSFTAKFLLGNVRPKVIYRIGGWSFNDPWSKWKKRLWTIAEKKSAPWKDIIIVNNSHDLKQAEKLGIKPKNKIVLIHNGIDPYKLDFLPHDEARFKLFSAQGGSASGGENLSGNLPAGRQEFFPAPGGPASLKLQRGERGSPNEIGRQANTIIGTVANLYPTKGIKYLIGAAEYFRNNEGVVFVVIGDGPEYDNLKLKIENLKLEKRVFLVGRLPDAHKLIPAFDVFVLPSVKEGFPWAIIEAMAAKLPVIATRVGAVPEIIENGKNGFIVEPANPAALAGKIKELLTNDHLYKEFAIQGHQTVLFNFSEDKMVKEIEGVI